MSQRGLLPKFSQILVEFSNIILLLHFHLCFCVCIYYAKIIIVDNIGGCTVSSEGVDNVVPGSIHSRETYFSKLTLVLIV